MRNSLPTLLLLGAGLLAFILLLPILGVLFIILIGLILVVVGLVLAAPFLARLPWFRNRIHVRRHGGFSSVRFGRDTYTTYEEPHRPEATRLDHGDVIDVEGRELPSENPNSQEKQG
ncbi:MAG: hypothetical protein K0R39_3935 [Symbiobacteriaceae bacterium]|nr:hypothetical protein [Symbiobacteriaceae bacterium]